MTKCIEMNAKNLPSLHNSEMSLFKNVLQRPTRSAMMYNMVRRSYTAGQMIGECDGVTLYGVDGAARPLPDIFKGKRVVLFGIPAAFTPTCTNTHVPAYLQRLDDLKKAGADLVACVAVNDRFVMDAWQEQVDPSRKLTFLADPEGYFTNLVDQALDLSAAGLGPRSKRYSMIVNDGHIWYENVEESPGKMTVSGPDTAIAQLGTSPCARLDAEMLAAAERGELEHCLRTFWSYRYLSLAPTVDAHLAVISAYAAEGDASGVESFASMLHEAYPELSSAHAARLRELQSQLKKQQA